MKDFASFYAFYLKEHSNSMCRLLHVFGSSIVLLWLLGCLVLGAYWWLLLLPVWGYGFAWVGHFLFEKNRPATFKHPFYSLAADWVMFFEIITGQRGLKD